MHCACSQHCCKKPQQDCCYATTGSCQRESCPTCSICRCRIDEEPIHAPIAHGSTPPGQLGWATNRHDWTLLCFWSSIVAVPVSRLNILSAGTAVSATFAGWCFVACFVARFLGVCSNPLLLFCRRFPATAQETYCCGHTGGTWLACVVPASPRYCPHQQGGVGVLLHKPTSCYIQLHMRSRPPLHTLSAIAASPLLRETLPCTHNPLLQR